MSYPNKVLTEVCEQLLDDWSLSPEDIASLAADIPGQVEAMLQDRAEAAYERQQEALMESGGPDDGLLRRDLIAAGRGHLLRSS